MTIPKKGGYSGGRPASEMRPPVRLRKRVADPRDDLRYLVHGDMDESGVTIHAVDLLGALSRAVDNARQDRRSGTAGDDGSRSIPNPNRKDQS